MRQKILYISFLAIMILFLVLINRKPQNLQPVQKENNQQPAMASESVSFLGENTVPLSKSKSGIIFIKKDKAKISSQESFLSAEKKKIAAQVSYPGAVSSSSSRPESAAKAANTPTEESSGVTKTNKHLTPEIKQELTDQGILIL